MAQLLYETFDSDTAGSAPPNTTSVAGTWKVGTAHPVSGTQDLEDQSATLADGDRLYWTSPAGPTNQCVQADFLINFTNATQCVLPSLVIYAQGALTTSNAYILQLNLNATPAVIQIYYFQGPSTFTQLGTNLSTTGVTLTNGSLVTIKFQVKNGTPATLQTKMWQQGGTEPSSWQSVTDGGGAGGAGQLTSGSDYGVRVGLLGTAVSPGQVIDNFFMGDADTEFGPWGTTYTVTGPSSGYAGAASTNFTVTPSGPMSVAETINLSDGGVGGTFSPTSVSLAQGVSTAQTFTYTPPVGHDGNVTLSFTNTPNNLTNPGNLTYDSLIPTVSVSPTYEPQNVSLQTLTLTGTGTTWSTNTPSWSISGVSGVSLSSPSVTNNTSMTIKITTGAPTGVATATNSVDNSTFKVYVGPTTTLAKTVQFGSTNIGLAGTIGYTIYNTDGSIYAARTTSGISELDSGVSGSYIAAPTVPMGLSFGILWDTGGSSPQYASDEINPSYIGPAGFDSINCEPNAGINPRQVLSLLVATLGGEIDISGTSNTIKAANDTSTTRITATCDATGRKSVSLTIPP